MKKLIPFDIEKAKAGAKIVDANRQRYRIISYDRNNDYNIVALLVYSSGSEAEPLCYDATGKPMPFTNSTYLQLEIEVSEYDQWREALKEGKVVEFRYKDRNKNKDDWAVVENLFSLPDDFIERCNYEFRIRPEPKLRPWKPEEIPVGAYFKCLAMPVCVRPAIQITEKGIYMFHENSDMKHVYTFNELLSSYNYSIDHGKTWLPCGIEE